VVNPASYAIDRDSATYWSPAANQPLSGLKAATEDQESSLVVIWTDSYDFCKVVLNVNTADSTLTKGGGKDYVIEYATMTASGYGNATWTQVASGQQGPGVTSVENNFVNPVSTSMLRLHYLSTYGHIPVVNEVVAYKRIERQYLFGVIPLFKQ